MLTIDLAFEHDVPKVAALLCANRLSDLGLHECADDLLIARDGARIVGCAALERYDPCALLRSVAVEAGQRGRGLGTRLTKAALERAQEHGITDVYLLTETAGDFFPRCGFREVKRAVIPQSVKRSVEFTTLCPESALAMHVRLVPVGTARPRRRRK